MSTKNQATVILSHDELSCAVTALLEAAITAEGRAHWASAARDWNLAARLCSAMAGDNIARIETAQNCKLRAQECTDILMKRVAIATYRAEHGLPPLTGV